MAMPMLDPDAVGVDRYWGKSPFELYSSDFGSATQVFKKPAASKPRTVAVSRTEVGVWEEPLGGFPVFAIKFSDGSIWDAVCGWRSFDAGDGALRCERYSPYEPAYKSSVVGAAVRQMLGEWND